jgi:fructose-1,6-bisphosphatase/sedoheptulose 1,7-bisphosphatase-like protein
MTADHIHLRRSYQENLDRINRATDAEIDEAMASILRDQRKRNVLRPAPRRARTLAGDNHE